MNNRSPGKKTVSLFLSLSQTYLFMDHKRYNISYLYPRINISEPSKYGYPMTQ